MKRIILVAIFTLGFNQFVNSQIDFGIKGGVNYNSESIEEVQTDIFDGAKSKTGFHAGIWTRIKLPVIGLYIRPELVYTQLSNEVTYLNKGIKTTYDFSKVDIPVLLGTKVFGVAHIFGGPSFQYILDSDFDIEDLKDVNSDGFSLGLQFGAGLELGKLGLDVRWERALSDTESSFVDSNVGGNEVNFDTRVNQIIVGLSYRF